MAYKVIDFNVMEELMTAEECALISICGEWDGSECVETDEWADGLCVWPAFKEHSTREDNGYDFMCEIYDE